MPSIVAHVSLWLSVLVHRSATNTRSTLFPHICYELVDCKRQFFVILQDLHLNECDQVLNHYDKINQSFSAFNLQGSSVDTWYLGTGHILLGYYIRVMQNLALNF